MCGLVGMAGTLDPIDVTAFKQLLFVDALRGDDSTGVASVDYAKDIDWVKCTGTATDLIERKTFDRVVTHNKCALIGHNRYGTMGGKTNANAHPFECDHIVGAHNGTITYSSKNKLQDGDTFDTDSEAIFNNIAAHGVDATIPLLDGAYALVYYNKEEDTINLIRNDKRPLFYTYDTHTQTLYWASEEGMLSWILTRNKIDHLPIIDLPIDRLMTFPIPNGGQVFSDLTYRDLKGYTPPPVVAPANGSLRFPISYYSRDSTGGYEDYWHENPRDWSPHETMAEWKARTSPVHNSTTVVNAHKNPKTNSLMTYTEFYEITQNGCDWCGIDLEYDSDVKFIVSTEGSVECFCTDCSLNNSEVSLYMKG